MTRAPFGIYLFHIAESFRNVVEYTEGIGIDIETVWRITEHEARASLSAIEKLPECLSAAAVYA